MKQSAARQSWEQNERPSRASFDIAVRTGYYIGNERTATTERLADIYVFAWHGVFDSTCDQTDPTQWTFHVIHRDDLPPQKSMGLTRLKDSPAVEVSADQLRVTVDAIVAEMRELGLPLRSS